METSSTIRYKVLKLDPQDNVRIAFADLCKGEHINFDTQTYLLESAVPAKLKFSTEELAPGASVRMYRVLVGKAAEPIRPGGRFTTNNLHHKAASFHAKNQRLSLDAARRLPLAATRREGAELRAPHFRATSISYGLVVLPCTC